MSAVIGAASASNSPGSQQGGSNPVALQAQLDRCTKQLGDWVSCSSGKTSEGKQIIQALQEKISSIKAQLQSAGTAPTGASANGTNSQPPVQPALAAIGTVGTLLNAFA